LIIDCLNNVENLIYLTELCTKMFELSPNKFQLHFPVDINSNKLHFSDYIEWTKKGVTFLLRNAGGSVSQSIEIVSHCLSYLLMQVSSLKVLAVDIFSLQFYLNIRNCRKLKVVIWFLFVSSKISKVFILERELSWVMLFRNQ
jgi:hypothetical protein